MKAFLKRTAMAVFLSFVFWEARWVWYAVFSQEVRIWTQIQQVEYAKRAVASDRYVRRCPDAVPSIYPMRNK